MKALLDTNILIDYLTGIDAEVAEIAVAIRRKQKMRLPDAIIWASAKRESALLDSRNTKDFPADLPGVRAPYRL